MPCARVASHLHLAPDAAAAHVPARAPAPPPHTPPSPHSRAFVGCVQQLTDAGRGEDAALLSLTGDFDEAAAKKAHVPRAAFRTGIDHVNVCYWR